MSEPKQSYEPTDRPPIKKMYRYLAHGFADVLVNLKKQLLSVTTLVQGVGLLVAYGVYLRAVMLFWGYVQDDAYISLRYALNLVAGRGLVFNEGERVEGFTNMGWTLLGAFFEWSGLNGISAWQCIGVLSGVCMITMGYLVGRRFHREMGGISVAILVASSPAVQLWSVSGLEQVPFAVLLLAGGMAFGNNRYLWAHLCFGLAFWLRPEAPLAALVAVFVLFQQQTRQNGVGVETLKRSLAGSWVFLALAIPLLLFRYGYFGAWVPNTFLVKGAASWPSHQLGLIRVKSLASMGGSGWLWWLVPLFLLPGGRSGKFTTQPMRAVWILLSRWMPLILLAAVFFVFLVLLTDGVYLRDKWELIDAVQRQRDGLLSFAAIASVAALGLRALVWPTPAMERYPIAAWAFWLWSGIFYYYVRIGGDFLMLHRLYITGIPMLAITVVAGVSSVFDFSHRQQKVPVHRWSFVKPGYLRIAATVLVVFGLGVCIAVRHGVTQQHQSASGVRKSIDACHGAAGRALERTAQRHAFSPVVVIQDAGYITINAPNVRFFDVVGLVSKPVAERLYRNGYSPYWRYLVWGDKTHREKIIQLDSDMRQMISDTVRPDYAVINVGFPVTATGVMKRAKAAYKQQDAAYFSQVQFVSALFYGWPQSAQFRDQYVFARAYRYSDYAYLMVWRRRDAPPLETGRDGDQ